MFETPGLPNYFWTNHDLYFTSCLPYVDWLRNIEWTVSWNHIVKFSFYSHSVCSPAIIILCKNLTLLETGKVRRFRFVIDFLILNQKIFLSWIFYVGLLKARLQFQKYGEFWKCFESYHQILQPLFTRVYE